jgi:hypothetical protein
MGDWTWNGIPPSIGSLIPPSDGISRGSVAEILTEWDRTAAENNTGVGRAYFLCARDLRKALGLTAIPDSDLVG